MRPVLVPLLLIATLAACRSAEGTFPSLAKRPVEAQAIPTVATASTSAPPPSAPLDPASQARVAAAEAASVAADQDFNAALPAARAAAAKAGAPGEEAWVIAQQDMSALEADRARGRAGLADLDDLTRELLDSGDAVRMGEARAVEAAAARLQARNDAESSALGEIERRLAGS